MMKTCTFCVMRSGTVSSAMVAGKLKGAPEGKGLDAAMVEAARNSISTEITGKKFDLIACKPGLRGLRHPEGKGSWHADRSVRGQGSR